MPTVVASLWPCGFGWFLALMLHKRGCIMHQFPFFGGRRGSVINYSVPPGFCVKSVATGLYVVNVLGVITVESTHTIRVVLAFRNKNVALADRSSSAVRMASFHSSSTFERMLLQRRLDTHKGQSIPLLPPGCSRWLSRLPVYPTMRKWLRCHWRPVDCTRPMVFRL